MEAATILLLILIQGEVKKMKNLGYVIVFVYYMKRSVSFYRDLLGLPLKFESPHWTEFANEGTTIALHPTAAPPLGASTDPKTPPGTCHLGFGVDNLDDFHKKMAAHHVTCIEPPRTLEFSDQRLAVYADPDGLRISVSGK